MNALHDLSYYIQIFHCVQGQFAPVKGAYSQEFKNLIMDMLQREPEYRPSAAEVWNQRLSEVSAINVSVITMYHKYTCTLNFRLLTITALKA